MACLAVHAQSRPAAAADVHAYRPDIDGLRAVAVLAVVAYHAMPAYVPGGFVGVDIFFVISGFLISRLIGDALWRGAFDLADFYARRVKRLFPALIVVLGAAWGVGWFVLLASEYRQLGTHIAASAFFLANVQLWTETSYFDVAARAKPLLHLWSLGVEEQFYLVWPALLMAGWRRPGPPMTIAIVGVVSVAISLWLTQTHPSAAFYLPLGRLWEMLAGAGLALVVSRRASNSAPGSDLTMRPDRDAPPRWRQSRAIVGGALLYASIAWMTDSAPFPGWRAGVPVLGTVLLISAGPGAWGNRMLSWRPLVFVGLISYPLYLWHWPLLTFLRILTQGEPAASAVAWTVGASIVLATLTYLCVERPIRRPRTTFSSRLVPIRLAGGLAVVAAAGLVVSLAGDRMPNWFRHELSALAAFKTDYSRTYREGRCLLREDQRDDAFAAECVDPPERGGPLVFVWGDSHAAHLYHGLQVLQRTTPLRVAQFTAQRCPPMIGVSRPQQPYCRATNDAVLTTMARLHPEVALLAGRWPLYDPATRLEPTIAAIRAAGVRRVVVVGPVPHWNEWVPRMLMNEVRHNPLAGIPQRMPARLASDLRALDRDIRMRAERAGAEFVSALGVFCDADMCLTRIGDRPDALTAWDETHLADAGSEYLVAHLASRLTTPSVTADGG